MWNFALRREKIFAKGKVIIIVGMLFEYIIYFSPSTDSFRPFFGALRCYLRLAPYWSLVTMVSLVYFEMAAEQWLSLIEKAKKTAIIQDGKNV